MRRTRARVRRATPAATVDSVSDWPLCASSCVSVALLTGTSLSSYTSFSGVRERLSERWPLHRTQQMRLRLRFHWPAVRER